MDYYYRLIYYYNDYVWIIFYYKYYNTMEVIYYNIIFQKQKARNQIERGQARFGKKSCVRTESFGVRGPLWYTVDQNS